VPRNNNLKIKIIHFCWILNLKKFNIGGSIDLKFVYCYKFKTSIIDSLKMLNKINSRRLSLIFCVTTDLFVRDHLIL